MPERYIDGIHRAEKKGRIRYHECVFPGHADFWSHLPQKDMEAGQPGGIWKYNSRPLHPLLVKLLEGADVPAGWRAMELGMGMGAAAATLYRMLARAKIHAVGLTPVNPYLLPVDDFHQRRVQFVTDHPVMGYCGTKEFTPLPPDILLHAQRRNLCTLFEKSKKPFMKRQYIGYFQTMRREQFPRTGYHLIDDCAGVLMHAVDSFAPAETVELQRTRVCALVYALLRETGTLFLSNHGYKVHVHSSMRKGDQLRVVRPEYETDDPSEQLFVLTKPGSPFNPALGRLEAEGLARQM